MNSSWESTDTPDVAKERHVIETRTQVSSARWIAIGAIGVIGALLVTQAGRALSYNAAFLPAILTVTCAAFALGALLLFQDFLSSGRVRLAGFGAAYLFGAAATVPNALAYPGVVSRGGWFHGVDGSAAMFWGIWHLGFALLLIAAFAVAPFIKGAGMTQPSRRILVAACVVTPLAITGIAVALVTHFSSHFAGNIHGSSYTEMRPDGQIGAITFGIIAFMVSAIATRKSRGIERWIPVSAASALTDSVVALAGHNRYSLGWYSSHFFGLVTGSVLVGALLVTIARLYREAEQAKHLLEDEALNLLKETRAARYREDRLRRIIENAADAYIEIDTTSTIRAWNGKAAEMFGWRPDEAIGANLISLLMAEEGQEQLHTFVQDFWEDGERFDGARAEIIVVNNDGVEFPVEVTMWVDESDFQPQMNFFLRDITVRRQAEEQMQRALEDERQAVMRLQELDRAKTDFVSSVSHELRSPLTSTLGFLELLADGEAGELNAEQSRMVEVASRNANRLFGLIEDLLTLARIEENAFRVSFRPVRIEPLVESIVHHNEIASGERGIDLKLAIEGSLGVCPGDEQQLARALDNVVGNAVKFTPSGGSVNVGVRREPHEVIVTVTDTGIGIPPDEQPHLFNRFYRASVAIEQQHAGTGLGLTIAKAIIDHHGGSIDIESRVGLGTTVTVRFPALPVDETIHLPASA